MEYTDKQVQILEAAEKLFSDHGFSGTSVRDIAQDAGVNLAMISYYFGSKEKLLEALFSYRAEGMRLKMENLIYDETLTPLQKVEKLIDSYVDKIMSQQSFHRIMVREQMLKNDSLISKQITEFKKGNQELIAKLIQDGQKKGAFKKKIDILLMMTTMVGTANQLVTAQHFYKEMNNLQDMPEADFQKYLGKKLSLHIKSLFKAMLTYEN